jgi:protoporphyrinogen/coproporphyrinogen III oxidase
MIGSFNPNAREVTVVGGGIAGLLAAYALNRKGYEVRLIEASGRVGGLIRTNRGSFGISESAAHSLLVTQPVRELFDELGVRTVGVRSGCRTKFVYREKMRLIPLGFGEVLRTLSRAVFVKNQGCSQVTLAEWGREFLGDPATQYLLAPMLNGIYAATPGEISVEAAFPEFRVPPGQTLLSTLRKRKRARLRRERPIMQTPAEGMQALVDALEIRLRDRLRDRFELGVAVRELPKAPNLVLTVPPKVAAELLVQADPDLSRNLDALDVVPMVSVTAFVGETGFGRKPQGVGVLLAPGSPGRCLGILFNSSAFPGRLALDFKGESFTLMYGGTQDRGILDLSDEEIRDLVQGDLERILGFKGTVLECVIQRQNRAIPLYGKDLLRVWDLARQGWCSTPGRVLFGNYTGAVSIRGMIETVWKSF